MPFMTLRRDGARYPFWKVIFIPCVRAFLADTWFGNYRAIPVDIILAS
jgi:hypothetical protein